MMQQFSVEKDRITCEKTAKCLTRNKLHQSGILLVWCHVGEADKKNPVAHVELTPTANAILDRIKEDTGVQKVTAIERIFEWFFSLDRKLRLAVLNKDEPTQRELLRLVLMETAGLSKLPDHSTLPVTLDECLKLIHALTARAEELSRAYRTELSDRAKKK